MMRQTVLTLGFLALVMCGTTTQASAKITQYECRFEESRARGGGWVPSLVYITENDQSGEMLVYDPIIEHFYDKPIATKLTSETKSRKTFTWEVNARNKGQSARFFYTLTYYKNGQPAKLRAHPGGYDNSFNGQGSCKVTAK
jgi:hypothetical protein